MLYVQCVGVSDSVFTGILEAHYTNLKCRCISLISNMVNLSFVDRIQVIRPGNGCPNIQVVIWTKTNKALCVDPRAMWLQKVLKYFMNKSLSSTPQAPVSKRRAA